MSHWPVMGRLSRYVSFLYLTIKHLYLSVIQVHLCLVEIRKINLHLRFDYINYRDYNMHLRCNV